MIEYDSRGNMKYNPELHFNQGTSWTTEDLEYFINWLDVVGYEEMSLALGRDERTLRTKAYSLRKKGLMKKNSSQIRHRRLLRDGEQLAL